MLSIVSLIKLARLYVAMQTVSAMSMSSQVCPNASSAWHEQAVTRGVRRLRRLPPELTVNAAEDVVLPVGQELHELGALHRPFNLQVADFHHNRGPVLLDRLRHPVQDFMFGALRINLHEIGSRLRLSQILIE